MRVSVTRMTGVDDVESFEFRTAGDFDVAVFAKALNLGRERKQEATYGYAGEVFRQFATGSIFIAPEE